MGLRQNILEDTIAHLGIRGLIAVDRGALVREVVEKMRLKRIGCAIVVDDAGKPVGKFTERKLLKLLLDDPRGMDQPVGEFMYAGGDPISREKPIAAMVELMKSKQLRFICVTDEQGKAVGLTGQKGLMEYITEHFPRQVKVQMMDSKLHMDHREGA